MTVHRVTITKLPDPLTPAMERVRAVYARKHRVPLSSATEPEESAPRPAVGARADIDRIIENLRGLQAEIARINTKEMR